MREKLATLPLTQLKELAKSQGIRNISGLRKAELIDRLCEAAESAGGAKVPAENNENRENTAAPMQAERESAGCWKCFRRCGTGENGIGETGGLPGPHGASGENRACGTIREK